MSRLPQFLTFGRAAIIVSSWAIILLGESSLAAGQDKLAPTLSNSPQLPDNPDPKDGSTLKLTHGEFSRILTRGIAKANPLIAPQPDAYVTVLENTPIRVMTDTPISTREARKGDGLSFTVTQDVIVRDVLIIPRGAAIRGSVVRSSAAGALTGSPCLIIRLTSLVLESHTYPIYTHQFKVAGITKNKQTITNVVGGAAAGGLMADYVRRNTIGETTASRKSAYAVKGAAIGTGAGLVVSAVIPGPVAMIPAESELDFTLAAPISIIPVSAEEATRLSNAVRSDRPMLYTRGQTP